MDEEKKQRALEARRGKKERFLRDCQKTVEKVERELQKPPALKKRILSWAKKHLERAKRGNTKSLLALKCGDCVGWDDLSEIYQCTLTHCPLHPLRPRGRMKEGE